MAFLRQIFIEGLFGLYDHTIELRSDPAVTVVAGPNGVGKTTLLRLTTALLAGDFTDFAKQDFDRLTVTSDAGTELLIERVDDDEVNDPTFAELRVSQKARGRRPRSSTFPIPVDPPEEALPPFVERLGRDVYLDHRSGDTLPADEVRLRYGSPGLSLPVIAPPDWFDPSDWSVDFIETKRLDTAMMRERSPRRREPRAPIYGYLSAVGDAIRQARFESERIAQARSRTFPRRLLTEASHLTVKA